MDLSLNILNCPFCQAATRPVTKYARDGLFYVECTNDDCAAIGPSSRESIKEAVRKWNSMVKSATTTHW